MRENLENCQAFFFHSFFIQKKGHFWKNQGEKRAGKKFGFVVKKKKKEFPGALDWRTSPTSWRNPRAKSWFFVKSGDKYLLCLCFSLGLVLWNRLENVFAYRRSCWKTRFPVRVAHDAPSWSVLNSSLCPVEQSSLFPFTDVTANNQVNNNTESEGGEIFSPIRQSECRVHECLPRRGTSEESQKRCQGWRSMPSDHMKGGNVAAKDKSFTVCCRAAHSFWGDGVSSDVFWSWPAKRAGQGSFWASCVQSSQVPNKPPKK